MSEARSERKRQDEQWMARALELAQSAKRRTSPNPMVGAVVVQNGRAVGEGCHQGPGHPHAEAEALKQAQGRADGAALYVNLEPCAHEGRTPPCADLLVKRGVARVVSAIEDPDERVSGRGHARLRAAGIQVEIGLMAEEARRLNAPYLKWKRRGVPFVTLKMAMSLDGKTATGAGESKWITSEAARLDGRRLRVSHDAILIGVGSALADDPRLTARLPDSGADQDPLRVVADTHARVPPTARMFQNRSAKTIVAVGETTPVSRVRALESAGAEAWRLPLLEGRVCLESLLRRLGGAGALSVLAEGGSRMHGSLVRSRLADRVAAYIAPIIIGGEGLPAVGDALCARLSDALRIREWTAQPIPPDIRIDGYIEEADSG
ncbi:MAG: bifunctional diaminohydroxyphosphoribosylaminopyrimidine deaminase/5-amino-6-(5-phosphoribosylamino)uracil reductase RibD [Candidatus Poribacteria bacterium]|nr:bifunctional diaminohydroxyphosphoribosylaminopyrimidine deaminase/5-amino-6-(5-phosphoribosylamino)uracil reductase RibD [Candidatus Poribacteria bacterium]